MQKQGTLLYQQLCVRFGLSQDAVLSNGKLLKGMLEYIRELETY